MKSVLWVVGIFAAAFVVMVAMAGWDRPPIDITQGGYRGLAMEHVVNPRREALVKAQNQLPEPFDPVEPGGPPATEIYTNIPVLADLSQEQFDRLMLGITQWVSPEQGCAYCHDEEKLEADTKYTKPVSARMLQMTAHINKEWKNHVGETGVTCYTCHRGKPVPDGIWFTDPGPPAAKGAAGNKFGHNVPTPDNGSTSLPYDPFTTFLKVDDKPIRIIPTKALPPTPGAGATIRHTEESYSLMMHISGALGVNCTYCHNSRSFFAWDQSTPQRTTAWHGINLVRELNTKFMEPLTSTFPANRLGPTGDVAKVSCATCHQGVAKPLYGAPMLAQYPELDAAK